MRTVKSRSEASSWHPDEGVAANAQEMETMARVLEARHGALAGEIAEFFALVHGAKDDAARSWAWNGVAETIRQRERVRLAGAVDAAGMRQAG